MTEKALGIIEDYLQLVRRHLPNSIAEDILDELRDYMVEAATEEGGGTLSPESAKRTVARFGAPSEVAEEYRESMLIDGHDASPDIVEGGVPSAKVAPPVEEGYGKHVSIKRGCLHFLSVIFVWSIATSFPSGYVWFLYFPLQLVVLSIFVILRGIFLRVRKYGISSASYSSWPRIQRFFTLPYGIFPRSRKVLLYLDIILTLSFSVFFFFSFVFLVTLPFLAARIWYIRKRIIDLDPILFVRRDALVDLSTLLSINLGFGISFIPYSYYIYNLFLPISVIIGFFYGIFLILRLSGMSHGFWFDRMKINVTTDEITSSSLEEVKHDVDETYDSIEDELIEAEEKPVSHGRSVSYLEVILKTQGLNFIWLVSSLLITAALLNVDSSFLVMGTIALLFTQLPGTIGLHLGNIARAKNKYTTPWHQDDRRWSLLRRFLSFPEGVFPEQNTTILRFDILATLLVIASTVLLCIGRPMPNAIYFMFSYFAIWMGLRLVILNHRWSNPSSQRYGPLEILVNFISLIIGNYLIIQMTVGSQLWDIQYPEMQQWGPYAFVIWSFFGIYLLYSMVARGGKIWHRSTSTPKTKKEDEIVTGLKKTKPVKPTDPKRRAALANLKQSYYQAIGMITAIYVIVGLISSFVFLLSGNSIFTGTGFVWWNMVWIVGLAILSYTLASLQFLWRRFRVKRNPDRSIIGGRSRIEAILDGIIMASIVFMLFSTPSMIEDVLWRFLSDASDFPVFIQTFSAYLIPFAYLSLFLSPFIRLVGDLIGMSLGESSSVNRAIIVSGGLFVLAAAVIAGLYGNGTMYNFLPGIFYLITAPLIVQIVTSYLKLSDKEERKSIPPAREITVEEKSSESSEPVIEEKYSPPRQ